MAKTLQEILDAYRALEDSLIEAGGVLTEDVEAALATNDADLGDKLDGYAGFIRHCKMQEEFCKIEAEGYSLRGKALANIVKGLRLRMSDAMKVKGVEKIKTIRNTFSLKSLTTWAVREDTPLDKLKDLVSKGCGVFDFKFDQKAAKEKYPEEAPDCVAVTTTTSIQIR